MRLGFPERLLANDICHAAVFTFPSACWRKTHSIDGNVGVDFTYLVPLMISIRVKRINTKKPGEESWLCGL